MPFPTWRSRLHARGRQALNALTPARFIGFLKLLVRGCLWPELA
jgi:hypothetical protein